MMDRLARRGLEDGVERSTSGFARLGSTGMHERVLPGIDCESDRLLLQGTNLNQLSQTMPLLVTASNCSSLLGFKSPIDCLSSLNQPSHIQYSYLFSFFPRNRCNASGKVQDLPDQYKLLSSIFQLFCPQ